MKADRARAWTEAFALFSEIWPALVGTEARIRVWDVALADLNPEQIAAGAMGLIANHTHGVPSPGNLRQAALGRLVRVPVLSGFLKHPGGPPLVNEWREVRVPMGMEAPSTWQEAERHGLTGAPPSSSLPGETAGLPCPGPRRVVGRSGPGSGVG